MKPLLNIGILGSRGIPNAYGGFEQFAQILSYGLAEKGHKVWVYNSNNHPYKAADWNGVHIIHCKDWEDKIGTAGQFIYDYNCLSDARRRRFDILLQLGYTSNSIWHFMWPKKTINIVNMDGLEWMRTKYGKLTKRFLHFAEGLAAKHADLLIADSLEIQAHIKSTYNKEAIYIPYGADACTKADPALLKKFSLQPGCYSLLIARMEPENNIEMIIQGYLLSNKRYPLVIVGKTENTFGRYLKKKYPDKNIVYTGAIYNKEYIDSLRHYSHLYFHGHSVGGTNPSLLEAMACQCMIAAHNNVFNRAVLGEHAWYFSKTHHIIELLHKDTKELLKNELRKKNLEKINTEYNWPKIINEYENLFLNAYAKRHNNTLYQSDRQSR